MPGPIVFAFIKILLLMAGAACFCGWFGSARERKSCLILAGLFFLTAVGLIVATL